MTVRGDREARVPQGTNMHSFCSTCHRVIYNLYTHGPITPTDYNRTFCICNGEQTGIIKKKVSVFGLEDILGIEGAKKERARQKAEQKNDKK